MINNTEILIEKLNNSGNLNTTLEIVSAILGILFLASEIIGKSKCKSNSVLGWIASWFNNVSSCNKQEEEKSIEMTELKNVIS